MAPVRLRAARTIPAAWSETLLCYAAAAPSQGAWPCPMAFDEDAYRAHLAALTAQWEGALAAHRFDAAVVPAGEAAMYYQDDQAPPFHPSPHFARWFPSDDCERSVLLVRPGRAPRLHFHQPADYWHLPPALPSWADAFEVALHADAEALGGAVAKELASARRVALVGPAETSELNLPLANVNPEGLVNQLVFDRAAKTPFEAACMRTATATAVRGHLAARDAFYDGGSEFDIHMAYLAASAQEESKLPYPSIVALNEHAGVLHYQHYDRARPQPARSFLIDAGARSAGYHSDITRTCSATPGDDFDALVRALDAKQQALAAAVRPGVSYIDLQTRMHQAVAELLVEFSLIKCSAESAFERKLTDVFIPHGLGHLLGLQTHDVGGRLANAGGETVEPPERFPTLRYTRGIEAGHVVTVEPGLYFIPVLLDAAAETDVGKAIDWPRVREFLPCGGVRIEDNVRVAEDATENLTRLAFSAANASAA